MANVIKPNIAGVSSINVKSYAYGGSTQTGTATGIFDYEDIDFSHLDQNLVYPQTPQLTKKGEEFLDKIWQAYSAVGAFVDSVVVSATAGLLEDVTDGLVMAGGVVASKAALGIAWLQDKFGFHDAAERSRSRSDKIENWTSDYIAYDWSEAIYDYVVEQAGYDPEIAHGFAHTAGNIAGSFVGYTALTIATGGAGAGVMAAVGATSAAGNSAQKALQNGATFDQAAIAAGVAGAVGAASGGAMSKLGAAARGATNLGQVAGLTAAGAGVGAVTPTANFAAEYLTYGKDQYGLSTEGAEQYFKESGAGVAIATGAAIGGVSTGIQGFNGVKNYKKLIKSEEFSNYQEKVYNTREDNYKWDSRKKLGYNDDNYADYSLTDAEKSNLQKQVESDTMARAKDMHKQYGKGYAKSDVSEEEFFDTIQNGKNQESVYSEKYIKKYNKQWKADKNGEVDVVALKPGKSYDDFMVGGGKVGRNDGEFVMPRDVAEKALKKSTVNGKVDPVKLAKELALPEDTFKTGVVQVTQSVPKDQIKMPTSNLGGSAPGYWVPGGKTAGGATEGVVPQLEMGSDGNYYNSSGQQIKVEVQDYR